jgi:branched-chain amino acid aminotransferase
MTSGPVAIWVNGRRQPSNGVHVSALDRGFTLADGAFETMRVHGGRVFRLERHLARLGHALAVLEISAPPELRDWVIEAARSVEADPASLRVTVSRGIAAGGLAPPDMVSPTVVVTAAPMPAFSQAIYEQGLAAVVASGRRNERAATAGLKTTAYTDCIAALIEARRRGAGEAILLDTEDHCSEATASNLFVWTGGELLTPPVSCGALPGITRASILELAGVLGIPCTERPVSLDDLRRAQEAFLTSSLRAVVPLVRLDGDPIGSGAPGACTRRLAGAYADLVARECVAAVRA